MDVDLSFGWALTEILYTLQFEFYYVICLLVAWYIGKPLVTRKITPTAHWQSKTDRYEFTEDAKALLEAAQRRKLHVCKNLLDKLARENLLHPNVLVSYFRVCLSRKMTAHVIEMFHKHGSNDLAVIRVVLACAAEESNKDLTEKLFKEIGPRSSLRDWHARLRCSQQCVGKMKNAYEGACVVLKEMTQSEVKPDSQTYGVTFNIAIAEGKLQEAEQYLDPLLHEEGRYSAILKALADVNALADVTRLFHQALSKGKDSVVIYGTVLQAYVKMNELKSAMTLAEEMTKKNIDVSVSHRITLLNGLCKGRLVDDALTMFKAMQARDVICFNIMIKALTDSHRISEALVLLDQLESEPVLHDEIAYNCILQGCAYTDALEQALQTVERMIQRKIKPTVATMSALLKIYVKMNRGEEALDLFTHLHERYGISPDAKLCRQVVLGFLHRRQGYRALQIYQYFLSLGQEISLELNGDILSACLQFNVFTTLKKLIVLMAPKHGAPIPVLDRVQQFIDNRGGDWELVAIQLSILRRNSLSMK